MRYNIYADEASISEARYMLIGGLWSNWGIEPAIRNDLQAVRVQYRLQAEMKWTKVSSAMLPAYRAFVDTFFAYEQLSFRCIVIDTHILDYRRFHRGDKELGFYKFYFQLISRNLTSGDLYWLYTDERRNRRASRLSTLKITVNRWWQKRAGVEPLRAVEPRRSHDEELIQLADILLGAISYAWNKRTGSEAKLLLTTHIATQMGWPTLQLSTERLAKKLNIWHWQPAR
ncbi:MAG TPA: DUF3800 domain-containing protein [Chloroflexi bacterium]|nr:DUF3800 domain-containing protein [Chloroflexota bacterium]